MKTIFWGILLSFSSMTFANNEKGEANGKSKDKVINAFHSVCAADIEKAGCTSKAKPGELMKCLHAYKKVNKDFQLSEACKSSVQTVRDTKKSKDGKPNNKTK